MKSYNRPTQELEYGSLLFYKDNTEYGHLWRILNTTQVLSLINGDWLIFCDLIKHDCLFLTKYGLVVEDKSRITLLLASGSLTYTATE